MTTMRRLFVSMILGLAGLWCSTTVTATPNQSASNHVRAVNPTVALLIQRASERSQTFRGLLDTINASDGIVFIEPGRCSQGMSCFENVTLAGQTRFLWVKVDLRGNDCDLMALIGHELQHTIEVLGDRRVISFSEMYFFYSRKADAKSHPPFETLAAERTEATVRAEVRENSRCTKIR